MDNRNGTKGYGLTGLDYWRLSEELSVVDAAFLTLNLDPGCFKLSTPSDPANSKIVRVSDFSDDDARALWNGDIEEVELEPQQFRAVFKGLRNAVLNNKIRAKVVTKARDPEIVETEYGFAQAGPHPTENDFWYEYLLMAGSYRFFTNSDYHANPQTVHGEPKPGDNVVYFLKEPDWAETMLAVDDLRALYSKRGLHSWFFFPSGLQDGFRDRNHPRYTPKLATAVAAWEAVKCSGRNKSVKQTLIDWIVSNGVQFGLGNSENVVTPTVAEEVAKIANWQTGGGATKTSVENNESDENPDMPIQNFDEVKNPDDVPF